MKTYSILVSMIVCVAAGAGCSPYPRVEAEFGDSVRQMVRAQQVNPDATEAEPVMSGDGQRIDRALSVYRGGATQPSTQQQPVSVQIGSTSTTAQ
jgi:hypothetical protein